MKPSSHLTDSASLKIKHLILLLFTLILALASIPSQAQDKVLRVGVSLGEPFAIEHNNEYSGIAIDIWQQMADEMGLKYQFVSMGEHIDDAVNQLAAGKIDVLIGPIVPTAERMKLVDFTQPFYLNQIGLIVPVKRAAFFNALSLIFNYTITSALLVLLVFFLLYLHVFWYYEIRPKQEVGQTYWEGVSEAFWLHTLGIDLGHIPSHPRTRQIRFLWLVLVTIFFSSVTASITSALTIALSTQYVRYSNANELRDSPVAAVIGTAPYDIAKTEGFNNLVPANNRAQAVDMLLQGKVEGYVDYYPIADYYLNQHQLSHQLTTGNLVIRRDTFSFALPINSPLRHPLDLKLREHQKSGVTGVICKKYFLDDEKALLNCEI